MKIKYMPIVSVALLSLIIGCNDSNKTQITFDQKVVITITNTLERQRTDELVKVNIADLKASRSDFNENAIVVKVDDVEIPSQLYDNDADGKMDHILFNVFLQPLEERDVSIYYAKQGEVITQYKSRTYAELAVRDGYTKADGIYSGGIFKNVTEFRVPDDHKDHNNLLKYEGPGWESDKVGYRFYLDWRNATDIFGKRTNDLVLKNVGVVDSSGAGDSYHEMADWGMDILKVGSTLGIGSIATWNDNKINMVSTTDSIHWKLLCNGPLVSEFQTTYFGWQVGDNKADLISRFSIAAGSRLTRVRLFINGDIDNIVTGFARHENVIEMIKCDDDGGWQYISSYGKQSLSDDKLGIAVLYNNDVTRSLQSNESNHFVVINAVDNSVEYYFAAAWEKEYEPIPDRNEFIEYLQQTEQTLNNPVQVKIN